MAAIGLPSVSVEASPVPEKRHRKYAGKASANNRVGVLWTPEEEVSLKNKVFEGMPLDEIATLHQRAPRAIEMRLAKIAADEVDESNPVTQVCAKYRVTETMVQRELKKKLKTPPVKKSDLVARISTLEEQVRELQAQLQQLHK